MASTGRISVLVSKELQTLLGAIRELPKDVNTQIRKQTKTAATPIWQESVRGHVVDRLQTRVFADSAQVAVSDRNVTLRAGGVGSLSSGTPRAIIAAAVEFGADPNGAVETTSRDGKRYTRRRGRQFNLPRKRGYVVYPAARDSIPRLASLWIQTTIRTVHEAFEKGGAK